MHFKIKTIGGHKYLYLIQNKWIDGKSQQVMQLSVGPADKVYKLVTGETKPKVTSFPFGKAMALLHAAKRLGFIEACNKHVKRRQQKGLTVGEYVLLMIIGRAEGARSRKKIAEWYTRSSLRFIFSPVHSLSSQNCLNYMKRFTDDVIEDIERDLADRLIELGYSPTRLIFDTTNQYTFIENSETLARKGNSKQKRYDKNIVGLGIAVNDFNLPFLSTVYPGNQHDANVFVEVIDCIYSRLEELKIDAENITLVFDKGINSDANIEKVMDKMHIVGSIPRNQAIDLLSRPLEEFDILYKNKKDHDIKGLRFENVELFDDKFTVVVSYNESTHKRQQNTYEKYKKKILSGAKELQKKARRKGRGRKLTAKGAMNRLTDLIPKQYRGIFDYSVVQKKDGISIKCDVITDAEKKLYESFGKVAVFTDNHEWSSKQIAQAYNSKFELEEDFKWLKDKVIMPLQPFYVWKDISIRAHVFLCVMGLLLYRFILLELDEDKLSLPKLVDILERIRIAVVRDDVKKPKMVVEEMGAEEAKIFTKLNLARFLP